MITEKLHKPSPDGKWLVTPLIKLFNNEYVVSGTWHAPDPIRLKHFWLSLTEEEIQRVLDAIQNPQRVWVLDRVGFQYSATLISLPDKLAEELHFDMQIRVNADGEILAKNEVCIADEVLAEQYLRSRGIQRKHRDMIAPVPILPIKQAWAITNDYPEDKKNISAYKGYWHEPKIEL